MSQSSVTNSNFRVQNTERSTVEFVEGIRKNDQETIRRIYKMYYPRIKSMVKEYRIRHLEPQDVFQEGLTRAVVSIRGDRFKGESSFYSFLYGICRNICLKEYSKKSRYGEMPDQVESESSGNERYELLNRVLVLRERLDRPCREIIDLRFCLAQGSGQQDKCVEFEKIAEVLDVRADNARKRFQRCMDRLREMAAGDQELNEYLED